jgi:hypothetical protein
MRWLARAATLVLSLCLVGNALAGDYHTEANLLCSQCHIMHYSQSHGYQPSGGGFYLQPGAGGPFHYLLRDEINNLCLACHDDAGVAPDVLGANGGNSPTDVRLAGFLNRLGVTGLAPTGHTLDSLDEAPGSDPPWKPEDDNGVGEGLNCINCHAQHGYAGYGHPTGNQYRNLQSGPGNGSGLFITYNHDDIGNNDLTRDVFERQAAEYDEGVVDWNEPDNTDSAIGAWCGGCHNNFHGTPGDANTVGGEPDGTSWSSFVRHPTAGVNIGALGGGHSNLTLYNAHTNKVKVMSELGVWDPAGADVTPTCISCHKAHGNGNAFGLIYRNGTGTLTENGDTNGTQLEDLCGQCHVQAEWFFENP